MSQKISPVVQRLHHRFQGYGRNAREWMRKCIMMLPDIERERVWEKKGFGSLAEYAGKLAGMSHETVTDGLRILHAIQEMPDMMQIVEQRGINCVRPIVTLLTQENHKFWAEKVKIMSRHTLETYVYELKTQQDMTDAVSVSAINNSTRTLDLFGRTGPADNVDLPQQKAIEIAEVSSEITEVPSRNTSAPPNKKIFAMSLEQSTIDRLEKLKNEDDWDAVMNELLDMREAMLTEKQQRIQQQHPAATEASSRHIPAVIMRHIEKRSRGKCEYPKCHKKYAIIHHTKRFALEQTHDPEHMVALCTQHERLAHLGLIDDEECSTHEWHVREWPDQHQEKYAVDRVVQKYRTPK